MPDEPITSLGHLSSSCEPEARAFGVGNSFGSAFTPSAASSSEFASKLHQLQLPLFTSQQVSRCLLEPSELTASDTKRARKCTFWF